MFINVLVFLGVLRKIFYRMLFVGRDLEDRGSFLGSRVFYLEEIVSVKVKE